MKWEIYLLRPKFEKDWKAKKPVPFPQAWEVAPKRVKTCSFVKADQLAKKAYPKRVLYTREVSPTP